MFAVFSAIAWNFKTKFYHHSKCAHNRIIVIQLAHCILKLSALQ